MPSVNSAADPLLFETDDLYRLAREAVVHAGLDDFKERRVTALQRDADGLSAEVEDAGTGAMLPLSLSTDETAGLAVDCPCDHDGDGCCRHGLAALFAYAADRHGDTDLRDAEESALEERRQRGRTEVRIRKLGGQAWFGTWKARSVSSETHFPRDYTVHIRSLTRRANYCNCPDFTVNRLGTCKHIEAVLHRVGKRRDIASLRRKAAPVPYVYLDWEADPAPQIRLHRSGRQPRDLKAELDRGFDAAGCFQGRLPEDFFRLADRLDGREDIHLGADAVEHARYLAACAQQRERAAEIRERVAASGGRLPGVRARLYPFQVEGVGFLAGNGRALLADDMGLGKTLQAIAAAVWLHQHAGADRILVVCPASLKQQWAREIERFTGLDARIVQGRAALRGQQYQQGSGFYMINYELVRQDLDVITAHLAPDLLILDEAQRIKNWRTKTAAAVKRIPSRYAFVLTGTPLENRLEDLYSLMQVVDPHVLGPLWRYLADFHVTDERGKPLGYRNLSELRRRLAPVMLRRDRRLVREQLPERIEQRLDVPLNQEQRGMHEAALSAASQYARIARRRQLTPTEQNRLMAALQQARMACNAAALVDPERPVASPKLDELVALLDELCLQGGLKAVVFSQWERMTALAEDRLAAAGLGCVRLHGGVPTNRRGALMDRFHADAGIQVFISTDAGGSGLNLQCASVVVNLDVPWNPAVLDQRIARVHRLGQDAQVQSILMVAADSYEERVLGLVQGKRELFDNVVDPEAEGEVVGVSRKLLETMVDDLAGGDDAATEQTAEGAGEPAADAAAAALPRAEGESLSADGPGPSADAVETALQRTIERIQEAFGSRIQRILGTNGGLLAVLDQVDSRTHEAARTLGVDVPVAVIDPPSLAGVERLGGASPLGETRTVYEADGAGVEPAGAHLQRQAREKLRAGNLLLEQDSPAAAAELLGSALLAAAAARAGRATAPEASEAAVWLYGEAQPRGLVDAAQSALIMRAIGLQQAAAPPRELVGALCEEAATFIEGAT